MSGGGKVVVTQTRQKIMPAAAGQKVAVKQTVNKVTIGGATTPANHDHGSLHTGLTDDDHTQYALLAGRSGGQTLIGGSATGNELILEGNSIDASPAVSLRWDSVTAGGTMLKGQVGSEANPRWSFGFDSSSLVMLTMGPGATAIDFSLKRVSAAIMELNRLTSANVMLRGRTGSDTQSKWEVTGGSAGGISIGTGGAAALDTRMIRSSSSGAGIWKVTSGLELIEVTRPVPGATAESNTCRLMAADTAGRSALFAFNDVGELHGPLGTPYGDFGRSTATVGGYSIDDSNSRPGLTAYRGFGRFANPTLYGTAVSLASLHVWLEMDTGTAAGSDTGLEWPLATVLARDGQLNICWRIDATTSIRMFAGWTDQTLTTMLASDDPPGNYIGIQYSSARDTTWQFVTKDGTTQHREDTGIFVSTDIRSLLMQFDHDVGMTMQLFDTVQQSSLLGNEQLISVIGENICPDTIPLRVVLGCRTLTGASRKIRTAMGYETALT